MVKGKPQASEDFDFAQVNTRKARFSGSGVFWGINHSGTWAGDMQASSQTLYPHLVRILTRICYVVLTPLYGRDWGTNVQWEMTDEGQHHYGDSSLVSSTGRPEPGGGTSSLTWVGRHSAAQLGLGHHQPWEQPCCQCLDKGHAGHPAGTDVLVCRPGNAVFLSLMTHPRWLQFPH